MYTALSDNTLSDLVSESIGTGSLTSVSTPTYPGDVLQATGPFTAVGLPWERVRQNHTDPWDRDTIVNAVADTVIRVCHVYQHTINKRLQ